MTELSKDELNLIVTAQLLVNINIEEVATCRRHVPKEEKNHQVLLVIME